MEQDRKCARIFIAIGGNKVSLEGKPAATLRAALAALADHRIAVTAASRFFTTPAFPAGSGADYVNAVVGVETGLGPDELLTALHRIEAAFGRERSARWGARTLDLDLLAHGDAVRPDAATHRGWVALAPEEQARRAPDRLVLPHPRLQDRAFVLVPWADIAPGWRHPVTGLSVADMLARLPAAERAEVRPF